MVKSDKISERHSRRRKLIVTLAAIYFLAAVVFFVLIVQRVEMFREPIYLLGLSALIVGSLVMAFGLGMQREQKYTLQMLDDWRETIDLARDGTGIGEKLLELLDQAVGAGLASVQEIQMLQARLNENEQKIGMQAAQFREIGAPTRKVREETRKRAELFKKIKDADQKLSYTAVAIRARSQGYPDASEGDVRNDYRAMGWEWERADRIR